MVEVIDAAKKADLDVIEGFLRDVAEVTQDWITAMPDIKRKRWTAQREAIRLSGQYAAILDQSAKTIYLTDYGLQHGAMADRLIIGHQEALNFYAQAMTTGKRVYMTRYEQIANEIQRLSAILLMSLQTNAQSPAPGGITSTVKGWLGWKKNHA